MFSRVRSRLTFANVTSVTALVLAMSGGAYALSGIPDHSGVFHGCVNATTGVLRMVKSARSCRHRRVIRHGGKRIVIPGELAIAWDQTGPRGPQGAPGLQGSPGTNGTNGTNGINGATNVIVSTVAVSNVVTGNSAEKDVVCNPGERATGGGAAFNGIGPATDINASFPTHGTNAASAGQTPDGWDSSITNTTKSTLNATFYVVCASP
jgi:hypothetical protein